MSLRNLLTLWLSLASVAALRVPAAPSSSRRSVIGTVLAAPLVALAPAVAPAAAGDSLSSRLAAATGVDGSKPPPLADKVVKAEPKVEVGNPADEKFAEIVAADIAAKEKKFGFALDEEDKATFELMLRNKYCGPQGLSAGWGLPGGPCANVCCCISPELRTRPEHFWTACSRARVPLVAQSNGCEQSMMGGSAGCVTQRKNMEKGPAIFGK